MAQTATVKAKISAKDKFWLATIYVLCVFGWLWLAFGFSRQVQFQRKDPVVWLLGLSVLVFFAVVLVLYVRNSLVKIRRKPVLKEWLQGFEKSQYHTMFLRQTLEGLHPLAAEDPVEFVRDMINWGSKQSRSKIDETLAMLICHGMRKWIDMLDSHGVQLWYRVLELAQDPRLSRTRTALNDMGSDGFKLMCDLPPQGNTLAPVLFARAGWTRDGSIR
jgi:hypothetical protein